MAVDLHWNVLSVEYDTMLVIIYIWRILESPFSVLDRDRDDTVVFTCRVIQASCISFIFHTELAFWISRRLCFSCSSDGFWIFFRLGKVDRDIQSTIFCINSPFAVLFDTVSADIITVLTQLVVESSCFFRRLFVFFPESVLNLSRTWHETVHDLCIKEITVSDTVFNDASCNSLI